MCCGEAMRPTVPVSQNSPLYWQCKACFKQQYHPTIEWPFETLRADDDALAAIGFTLAVLRTVHLGKRGMTQGGLVE
jgi:hypothetical protein